MKHRNHQMLSRAAATLSFLMLLQAVTSVMTEEKVRMCYFTNWAQYRLGNGRFLPDDIDPTLCTHIIYAFTSIDLDTDSLKPIEYNDQNFYSQITALKTQNPDLKVLLAVGGATTKTAAFEAITSSRGRIQAFADNVISYLRFNNFDGLDVDWEFPNADTRGMFQEFIQLLGVGFLVEHARTSNDKLILTMAVSGDPASVATSYGPREFLFYVDYVLLMAYDLWGSWSRTLGHHSPLYDVIPGDVEQGRYSMSRLVNEWTKNGASSDKLVLGMATYGRTGVLRSAAQHNPGDQWSRHMGQAGPFTRLIGFISYYEVCENLRNGGWRSDYSETGQVPYAWAETDRQYACYDDTRSVKTKAQYILDEGLAGAMFWALDYDDFKGLYCNAGTYPLIRKVKAVLEGTDTDEDIPTNDVTTPDSTSNPEAPVTSQTPTRTQRRTTVKSPPLVTTAKRDSKATPTRTQGGGTASGCEAFQCPGLFGYYPDPSDCTRFHQCVFATAFNRPCPPTLLFDAENGMCNWPWAVRCELRC